MERKQTLLEAVPFPVKLWGLLLEGGFFRSLVFLLLLVEVHPSRVTPF